MRKIMIIALLGTATLASAASFEPPFESGVIGSGPCVSSFTVAVADACDLGSSIVPESPRLRLLFGLLIVIHTDEGVISACCWTTQRN